MEVEEQRGTPAWTWVLAVGALISLCLCIGLVGLGALYLRQSETAEIPTEAEPALIGEAETISPPATESPEPTKTVPPTDAVPEAEPPTDEPPTATPEEHSPSPAPPVTDPEAGQAESPENAALRSRIEESVAEIRGLEPVESVTTVLLTREELRRRVEEDLFVDLSEEDAREFTLILHAFDFVPVDFDYYNFTLDLYSEQIAGFYDSETDEFVVVSDDDELDLLEQSTHAHEYMHALQDRYFSLDLLDEKDIDSEASAGLLAFVEGEAVLVENLYLLSGNFTFEQLSQMLTESLAFESPVLDNAPPVLASDLLFPYTYGYEFAQTLFDRGGFAALNEVWAKPPQSTEHIMHPDRYLAGDEPKIVAGTPLTGTLGAGWRILDEDTFGEFYLGEYLGQQLAASQAAEAAAGWGGDHYAVYWNEGAEQVVATLHLAWDTPQDSDEFAGAFADYASAKYGSTGQAATDGALCWQGADVTCLYRLGTDTLVVRAPDSALVQAIAATQ